MSRDAILSLICCALLALGVPALAETWNGGGGDDAWTTGGNWVGGVAPASSNTTNLNFAGTTRLAPVVDTNNPWTLRSLFFDAGAGAFTIGGNALDFAVNTEFIRNNSSNTQTFSNEVRVSAGGTITANSAPLVFNGPMVVTGTPFFRGGQAVTINGLISGTGGISRTDGGTLTLANNANNFTGNVLVAHGVLSVGTIADSGVACALGAGNTITLAQKIYGTADTGTLRYTGATASTNRTVLMQSDSAAGDPNIEVTTAGTVLTFNGNFQYSSGSTNGRWFLKGAGDGVINGNITTTGAALYKQGAGTWTLNGANTYTGTTVLDQGVLILGSTGGPAIVGNVQMGAGNTNQPHLRMAAADQFGPGVVMSFANTSGNWARFDLQGTNQTLAGLVAGTASTQGGAVVQNRKLGDSTTQHGPATLTLNGSGTYLYNGYLRDVDGGSVGNNTLAVIKDGTGTQTFVGSQITYTGGTTINGGTLAMGSANLLNMNAPLTINAGGTFDLGGFGQQINGLITGTGTITNNGAADAGLTLGRDNTSIVFNGVIQDGARKVSISKGWNGTYTFGGSASNTYTGNTGMNNGSLVLAKTVGNAIGGNLDIGGNGNYNSMLVTLQGKGEQIADSAVVTFNPGANVYSYLKLMGFNETVAGVNGSNGRGVIENTEGEAGVTADSTLILGGGGNYSYNGYMRDRSSGTSTGKLALTKSGGGTQTLGGTLIDYTGSTTVSGGTLRFLDLDDLHSSALAIAQDATVELSNTARDFNRFTNTVISGDGAFVKTGTGLLKTGDSGGYARWNMTGGLIDVREGEFRADYQLDQAAAWANNKASLNVEAGAFVSMVGGNSISVDALTGAGTVQNINSWGVAPFTVGVNDGSGTFSGTLRDNGGVLALTKVGAGTQTLSGSADNAGLGVTANQGTLILAKTSSAGVHAVGGPGLTVGGGTVQLGGTGGDQIYDGARVTVNSGTLDMAGLSETVQYLAGSGGSVSNSGATQSVLTLNLTNCGTQSYGGTIDGDIRVVVLNSTAKNTDVQTLTGANTFTGGIVIDNGHVRGGADANWGAVPASFEAANITLANGGVLQNNNSDLTLNANRGITLSAGAGVFYPGWGKSITVNGAITGPGSLVKSDNGTLLLTNTASDYVGGTTVTAGLLRASDRTIGAGNLTLQSGGIFFNVSGSGGGAYYDNDFGKAVTLGAGGGGFRSGWGNMTLSGPISGVGPFTVVNDGVITVSNAANSYDGNTTIGAGGSGNNATLQLGASEVIPHGAGKGNLMFNASSSGVAALDLNGQTETINALVSGGAGTSRVTGTGTLRVGANDADGSFGGNITSGVNLVKIGSGTQTLSGTLIDHTGSTGVEGGRLLFLDLDDLHSSQLVIATGAVAEFQNSSRDFNRFSATSIEGDGTFVKTGTGLLKTGNATNMFAHWNMTGGLIDVREGEFRADYQDNNPATGAWANNKASMNVEAGAFVSMVGGNYISVDALTGSGTVQNINSWGVGPFTVGVNGGSGTFSGTLRDNGGVLALTKAGAGRQVLEGNNTYSGVTNINGGTLLVNGTHSGGAMYTVADQATLGGSGTITAPVTVQTGGHIAPGTSPGPLGVGALVLQPDSFFDVEMSPLDWDLLDVTGLVSLNGAVLNLDVLASFSHYQGSQYMILQNDYTDSIDGVFADLPEGASIEVAGAQFTISYEGGTGNDIVLTAVPEPASALLLMLAAPAVAARVRRRLRGRRA